jgi:hypothetical protein
MESPAFAFVYFLSALFISVLAMGILLLAHFGTRDQYETMKVVVTPDGLFREAQTQTRYISWGDITRVRIWHNKQKDVQAIDVYSDTRLPETLIGYENLTEVAYLIQHSLKEDVSVEYKRQYIDKTHPFQVLILSALLLFLFAMSWIVFQRAGSELLLALVQISLGLSALFYRPVTRSYPQFRGQETFSGIMFLLLGIWNLVLEPILRSF